MTTKRSDGNPPLMTHVLVPVADVADAQATARAMDGLDPERITMAYVVEKGDGVPDKTPVEQSERVGRAAFDAFRETHPGAELHVTYGRDVVAAVARAADELDASAVVFRPRGGSRVVQFLAGDKALRLVTEIDRPVLSLPALEEET